MIALDHTDLIRRLGRRLLRLHRSRQVIVLAAGITGCMIVPPMAVGVLTGDDALLIASYSFLAALATGWIIART